MADKHPYMSGSGGIVQLVNQLKRSFPASVTAETLKKLGIASNNETYVLNIFRFIGVLDSENKKVSAAGAVFNKHDQEEFQSGFSKLVEKAYKELFDLHGSDAWSLDLDKLISFFRNHDGTSDIVGRRQATTFQTLGRVSGKVGDAPIPTAVKAIKSAKPPAVAARKPLPKLNGQTAALATSAQHADAKRDSDVALTVRIEINLPPGGDQSTYDAIFKSIREHLMNGNGV